MMGIENIRSRFPQYSNLSDEELTEKIRKKHYSNLPISEFYRRVGVYSAAADTGPVEAALVGAGKTFNDLGRGVQDLYYAATGDDTARDELRERMATEKSAYDSLSAMQPVATTVGEIAPTLAVPGAGIGAGLARRLGTEIALGGVLGGLSYAESPEDRLKGAAWGAGGGAAGAGIGAGLQRIAGKHAPRILAPEQRQMLDEAEKIGWRTTPADMRDSAQLAKLESTLSRDALMSAPFDRLNAANEDLANRIGRESIGMSPDGKLTDHVLETAKAGIRKGYDDLTPNGFVLDASNDQAFLRDIVSIDTGYMRSPMRGDQWPKLRDRTLELLKDPLSANEYHRITSEIARRARAVGGDNNSADPMLEDTLYALREAVDDSFERAIGGALGKKGTAELKKLRRLYRNLKTIDRPGVVKQGSLRVAPLRSVLKRQGKGIVRGDTDLGKLARVGEHFQPLGTSFTPEGMLIQTATQSPQSLGMAVGRAVLGNAIGVPYLRGTGALGQGMDIGQATTRRLAGGVLGYGSPAQLGRAAGLEQARNERDDDLSMRNPLARAVLMPLSL